MTQDVYMGRRVVDQVAVAALEGLLPASEGPDDEPPATLSVVI